MKIIDNQKHYTAKEVGMLVGRTHLTVHLWDTWSNELDERGDARLIPEPIKIGKQKTRYWNERDIEAIKHFADNIQRGDLAEFSQRQWKKKNGSEPTKKAIHMSEKKMLKTIDSKKSLRLEDKLIYAFIFLMEKEGNEVTRNEISEYFNLGNEIIKSSLTHLMEESLITDIGAKYIVL